MQPSDSRREHFVYCMGLAVIGLAVLLFALCMIVSVTTVLRSGQRDTRPLLTINVGQENAGRTPALPPVSI